MGLTKVGVNSGVVLISSGRHSGIITKTNIFKYTENFTTKKNQIRKLRYFSYFCSKHRLRVLVRTASARRF